MANKGEVTEDKSNHDNNENIEELPDPDPSDFQSIGLVLEELRRTYDDEERRREALDNKLNFLLGLNTLLISLLVGLSLLEGIWLALVVYILIFSVIVCLSGMRLREYQRPFEDTGHIYAFADAPNEEFQSDVSEIYEDCIYHNISENSRKSLCVSCGMVLTILAIFILALPVMLSILDVLV